MVWFGEYTIVVSLLIRSVFYVNLNTALSVDFYCGVLILPGIQNSFNLFLFKVGRLDKEKTLLFKSSVFMAFSFYLSGFSFDNFTDFTDNAIVKKRKRMQKMILFCS